MHFSILNHPVYFLSTLVRIACDGRNTRGWRMKEIEIGNVDTYPEFKEEESLDLKMEEPFNPSDINISSKQDTIHNLHITL